MRPLTEDETKLVFEKLFKYIGSNVKELVDRSDERFCFRLQKDRVFYVSETIMLKATNVSRDNLVSLGICFGKFTKSGKFNLTITCLDYLAQYAQHKIWVKPAGEMPFLYGNHVLKAHLGRITEDCEKYSGVVIYNMSDVPLGFGVSARSTAECRKLDPTIVVAFNQADVGEYLRSEDTMFAPEK